MPLPAVVPYDPASLAAALSEHGACLLTGLPDLLATGALREQLLELESNGALQPASIGRGQAVGLHSDIRGDATRWIDDESGIAAASFLGLLNGMRIQLNRRLFLGLEEVEAHFACYPVGTFYGRHRDRFRDSDARVLSVVTYLNPDWLPEHGGALRLYLESGPVDVLPREGVTVCFLSEIDHEVLPATRKRMSIAGWMRKRSALVA